ncbi:NAD(P)-dependent oxidoreductase [Actinomadura kijaniata]|uniref:NAD(P)-dependent oxidoreductase n=1 Tax=Actinomadura kijaniata TaxID=46161 RepID=UPI000833C9CE|nr:NAD(P)-binding domain-containing protein [Actinomadura kijaniata]
MGNHENRTPVTVIGLGLMGRALAGAFLRAGHPTTVWNRTAAKAEPLVAQGARPAGSPREAVAAGPLVVVCVTDYDAVRELLEPLEDVLGDRVLVNLTSGTSRQARETAAWAARRGVTYLDGAIMAAPQGIGTADALVYYSGPRAAFDLHEPTLRSLGDEATHLGDDHGLPALYGVAATSVMWGLLDGFLQGAALLGTAGVDASTFAAFTRENIGTIVDWMSGYARQIDDGAYTALDATIEIQLDAMAHLVHESESVGVSADLPRFFKSLGDRAVAEGHGGDGYAAMIELFRKPSAGVRHQRRGGASTHNG